MRFMIGECTTPKMVREIFRPLGWGRMWVHRPIRMYEGERWGFDNGAFGAWKSQAPWDEEKYMRRLDAAYSVGTPWVAVVPDRVGKGDESLEFSLSWAERMPSEWPLFLAVQDGMTRDTVEPHLDGFSGIFLGGTDAFKRTAHTWVSLARSYELGFHYGRASSLKRLEVCEALGVDSCDSTQPLWTKKDMDKWVAWFKGKRQIVGRGLLCIE